MISGPSRGTASWPAAGPLAAPAPSWRRHSREHEPIAGIRPRAPFLIQHDPTRPELAHEVLARVYVCFTGQMAQGEAYRHVRLLRESGREIDLSILEIGEELWDPRGKRLTLLFDPGRIKRGLLPHEQVGVALEAGQGYRLVVDRGAPLRDSFEKVFRVMAADRRSPNPGAWRLAWPLAGTRRRRGALTVPP